MLEKTKYREISVLVEKACNEEEVKEKLESKTNRSVNVEEETGEVIDSMDINLYRVSMESRIPFL